MRDIIISANDSSSSWMNNAALDDFVRDFNESASEIWEKRFRNSSKRSSVNEWLDMMRFVWKRIERMMMLDDWKRKTYRVMFNLQQRRWDLFVDWFDWFSSKQRRFFIIESINRFDSWAIHEDSLSWFS